MFFSTRIRLFYLFALMGFAFEEVGAQQNLTSSSVMTSSGESTSCPTWYLPTDDASQSACQCGDEFDGVLKCTEDRSKASVLSCYCVTQDMTNNGSVFMANCLFTCHLVEGNEYIDLPSDPSQLEEELCSRFHRKGPHCSQCVDGYAVSAFSIHLSCVECHKSNWLWYLALTFLPLTLFYFAVLFFRFHATTAWLDSYILFSQIITSPPTSRLVLYRASIIGNHIVTPEEAFSHPASYVSRIFQTVYSIWNLNFFQSLVPPFCLDPSWTAIQVIALDYLTAFYPLVLVGISYIILVLHARNFKPLVILWKPFSKLAIRFRNKVAISRYSVINSFATFLLLSYVKLVYVSSDLLHVTVIRYPTGQIGNPAWNYNASLPYFGKEHVGYGIFAVLIFIFPVLLPFFFLAVYPCKCFQKLCPWLYNKPQIHAIVDCFQGHYKDGTCGSPDYRYFPSLFLGIRLVGVIITEYVFSGYAVPLGSMMVAAFGTLILVVQPYKLLIHNRINGAILVLMSLWVMSQSFYHFPINNVKFYHVFAIAVDFILCLLPFCYFLLLVAWYVRLKVKTTMCTEKLRQALKNRRLSWRNRLRTETTLSETQMVESRAYSFPDRVVNPTNYVNSATASTST